jgi:pimeloyl-ACP methyl ester carboxylesterase
MALLVALLAAWIVGCGVVVSLGHAVRVADRAQPLRFSKNALACWARETATHALLVAMTPLGWLPRSVRGRGSRRPVVLVPGYLMNSSAWTFMAAYLDRRGWGRVHPINNRPFNGRIELFAEHLGREVERICQATGADTVDVVGHSMGGIVAAHWILHHEGGKRVNRLVTLGSPLRGTKMATFAFLREGRDMFPDSECILGLGPLPCPSTHVWSEQDHLVIPTENALADWAPDHVQLPWLGHMEMLTNLKAFRAVADALDPATAAGDRIPEGEE